MKSPFDGLTPDEIELARASVLRAQAIQAERRENETAIAEARRLHDQVGNEDPRVSAEIASAIASAESARESLDTASDRLASDLSSQSKASAAAAQFASLLAKADRGDDDARRAVDLAMDDLRHGRDGRRPNPVLNAIEEVVDRAPVAVAVAASNVRVDGRESAEKDDPSTEPSASTKPVLYPPGFESRFLAVGTRFFTKEQSAEKPPEFVFQDKGKRLEVADPFRPADIKALVDVAEARGWSSVHLTGTEEFRRAMWTEAQLRGMAAKGFSPTPADQARLDSLKASRAASAPERTRVPNAIERGTSKAGAAEAFVEAKSAAQRTAALERYPALKNAFALEAAMEQFANRTMTRAAATAFVERSRSNIARDLEAGVALPQVRLREARTPDRVIAREAQER